MLSLFRTMIIVFCGMNVCVGTFAAELSVEPVQAEVVGEMVVDDIFGDDLLSLDDIDPDNLRAFDDELEPVQISLKEKIEMIFLLFKSKTRGYRGGLLAHFEQHSNEYLIGSACVATMLIAAIIKKYTSHLCVETNGK